MIGFPHPHGNHNPPQVVQVLTTYVYPARLAITSLTLSVHCVVTVATVLIVV